MGTDKENRGDSEMCDYKMLKSMTRAQGEDRHMNEEVEERLGIKWLKTRLRSKGLDGLEM